MSMTTNGIALIMLFILAAATGGLIVALSALIGRRMAPSERATPYECGLDPVGTPRRRFSITFFLVAVIFIGVTVLFLRERLTRRALLGVLFVFAGVLLISLRP